MDIREQLKFETKGHTIYDVRNEKYKEKEKDGIGFRVSPVPFKLTKSQKEEMLYIGKAICNYMDACIELYNSNQDVKEVLDRGKPKKYINNEVPNYLFLRPDLILTQSGFSICEIETSPFGLGLAEVLTRTYGNAGFDPIITQNSLKNYIQSKTEKEGTIAYSDNVKSFKGQLDFLAEEIFSGNENIWKSQNVSHNSVNNGEIYRAFYLSDAYKDKNIERFLQQPHNNIPSSTPQFEEKALMAFIWDKRYMKFFESQLGKTEFELLRKSIPKTWILGEERYVDGGLPEGKENSMDICTLGKSKRQFVLKSSGFNVHSSWSEGVVFLHKMGGAVAREKMQLAMNDFNHLYIMQEFRHGKIVPMTYIDESGQQEVTMNARIRVTPYFSYQPDNRGELIAAKVTGCENTEYIHASTASINTAIIEDER